MSSNSAAVDGVVTEADVVVLGTGAAGLVAALAASAGGASVALFEKGDLVGGTTALSGGTCWIPNHPHMAAAGVVDSRERALEYLTSLSLGRIDPALAAAFVDTGPELVRWLEEVTPIRFGIVRGFPDYHPEHPGGMPGGGRSLDPGLFKFGQLGDWSDRVVRPAYVLNMMLTEIPLGGGTGPLDPETMAGRRADDARGLGQALVGGLLRGCLDRGIEPTTGARAVDLLVEDGRVRGVRFEGRDGTWVTRARRGVVLATGGFEWDPDLVRAFLRGPMTSPASLPTNTGDGLRMAMRLGAELGNMGEAWWVPTIELSGEQFMGHQRARLVLGERTLPRSIMVNPAGRRFTNEAANYNALGGAFHQFDPARFEYANLPCWLVFDAEYLRRYGFAGAPPGTPVPDLTMAPTVADLGAALGLDAASLEATVERWNGLVAKGHDDDFGRGDSAYDSWSGDPRYRPERDATLGAIDEPPFYAIEIHSGTLGTKGGPRTTVDGEVIDQDGQPIAGLFAAGNVTAGITAMAYLGAGGTIGPAMVFGYLAGRAAAKAD